MFGREGTGGCSQPPMVFSQCSDIFTTRTFVAHVAEQNWNEIKVVEECGEWVTRAVKPGCCCFMVAVAARCLGLPLI